MEDAKLKEALRLRDSPHSGETWGGGAPLNLSPHSPFPSPRALPALYPEDLLHLSVCPSVSSSQTGSDARWGMAASPSAPVSPWQFPPARVLGCPAASAHDCCPWVSLQGSDQEAPPLVRTPFPERPRELGSNEKLIRQLC